MNIVLYLRHSSKKILQYVILFNTVESVFSNLSSQRTLKKMERTL